MLHAVQRYSRYQEDRISPQAEITERATAVINLGFKCVSRDERFTKISLFRPLRHFQARLSRSFVLIGSCLISLFLFVLFSTFHTSTVMKRGQREDPGKAGERNYGNSDAGTLITGEESGEGTSSVSVTGIAFMLPHRGVVKSGFAFRVFVGHETNGQLTRAHPFPPTRLP